MAGTVNCVTLGNLIQILEMPNGFDQTHLKLLTILFPRYFGDATRGGEDDCKSCPCPLEDNKYAFLKDVNMNITSNMLLEALLSPAMHF